MKMMFPSRESSFFEQEESSEHLLDVFEISPSQKEQLKERVAKWEGIIRLMVHPYYLAGNLSDRQDPTQGPRITAVMDLVKKLAQKTEEETPLVFIMESRGGLAELSYFLKGMTNQMVVVPTYADNSAPKVPEATSYWPSLEEERPGWDFLVQFFKDLEVSKILLGGMRLDLEGTYFYGCVEFSIQELLPYFKLQLSTATYPEGREEMRRFGWDNLL